jgi:hypothetical protein
MTTAPLPRDWVPSIPRRYATTAIDGLLIIAAFVVPTTVMGDVEASRVARIVFALAMLLVYEPVCTGRFLTLGQLLTGVRVRDFKTGLKIGVARAWGRILVKTVLGGISFVLLPFIPGRRAIHDLTSGSIVILATAEAEFVSWAQGMTAATGSHSPVGAEISPEA